MNLTDTIFEIASSNPDRNLFLGRKSVSFEKFCKYVDHFGKEFFSRGIRRKSKCILLVPPSVPMFAASFALFRMGAIPIMIDPGMGLKNMVRCLDQINADFFLGSKKALLIRYLFPTKLRTIKAWIQISSNANFKLNAESINKYPHNSANPEDEAAIFFTSGSTGVAKAVVYKYKNLVEQIIILKKEFSYDKTNIDFVTFPLIGFFAISLGLTVVLARMNMTKPIKLIPGKLVADLNAYNCTSMFCSPMVLKKLVEYLEDKKIRILSLSRILVAGAPVNINLITRFSKLIPENAEINTPYGSTEALPISTINNRKLENKYSKKQFCGVCVGYPLPNVELKIIKISDTEIQDTSYIEEVQHGECGEIIVKGNIVTESYFNNVEANRLSKIVNPRSNEIWHRMGDLAYYDENRMIWLVGRKSQRVETIDQCYYTLPVEQYINSHAEVNRSAMVGILKSDKILPVICIELNKNHRSKRIIAKEIRILIGKKPGLRSIKGILFRKRLPVDPRHNAKIYREKLAIWASRQLKIS